MNAADVIRQDHRAVEKLFADYESLGDQPERKREIVNDIIRELSIHAAIEEEILYPTAREVLPQGDQEVQENLEEHQEAKEVLARLDDMSPENPEFDQTVRSLIQDIRHHVEEEEGDFLPKLEQTLDRESLDEIGDELQKAKGRAPTRPHPKAPSEPPGIKVAGPAAALLDRIRDRLQGRSG